MKRPTPPKPAPIGDRYVCSGCGYEYVPELGDEDGEIAPGTLFEQLPAEWVCPCLLYTSDEFAHTNAESSRHTKRYQDVQELLNTGIDVYTTVNVQHIELSLIHILKT